MQRLHCSSYTNESGLCMLGLLKCYDHMMESLNHVPPSFVTIGPTGDRYSISGKHLESGKGGSLPRNWTQNDRDDEGFLCFASIRFRHCQITLPLFERDWQSLKLALRHYSLPKVQFAIKTLPKDFSACSEKGSPYLLVKSVLAAIFLWQRGTVTWQYMLDSWFRTASEAGRTPVPHLIRTLGNITHVFGLHLLVCLLKEWDAFPSVYREEGNRARGSVVLVM